MPSTFRRQSRSSRAANPHQRSSQQASAGSSYRRSSVVSFRLALSNPTLPEITDGYETQLHHSLGHDQVFSENPADVHADYVRRRWHEGCRNATQLYREVCNQGYSESVKTFRLWVKVRLRDATPAPALSRASHKSSWHMPTSRQMVRLLTAEIDTLPANDRAFVNAVSSASPDVANAAGLARRFQSMICNREAAAPEPWLHDATTGPMSSFSRGIRRDVEAVRAALTVQWSTGPVEGKINKLKLIKRSMYGRVGIDLLRSRISGT
ncbi:transposase [Neorhizobium galegae]|nr:transposase [Neorhizobium galegae]